MLLWAFFSTSYSNAEIITVPLANGLSVTLSTNTSTPLQDLKNNPLATNVTMGDDSNVRVPLDFTFPFYNQKFTESWMYSNGAVNFKGSNVPGGFCCEGVNLSNLQDTGYNYSIMPLWTDLIALQGGSHYVLGDSKSMTYGWYGVSEYADTSRRSSFELSIDSTGRINTAFSGALVSYHSVTSGMIGDISKGEYYQYYNGTGFSTSGLSWTTTTGTLATNDPCKENPLHSTSCPGYLDALAKLNPAATTTATAPDSSMPPPPEPPPPGSSPPPPGPEPVAGMMPPAGSPPPPTQSAPPPPSASAAVVAAAPITQEKAAAGPVNLSFALNLIAKNSDREKALAQQAVATSIAETQTASDKAQQIAVTAANTAVAMSTLATDSAFTTAQTQANSFSTSRDIPGTATSSQQSNSLALQPIRNFNGISDTQQTNSVAISAPASLESLQSTQSYGIFEVQVQKQQDTDTPQQATTFMTDRSSPLREIIQPTMLPQTQSEQQATSVNRTAQSNELAVGVVLETLAAQPPGYAQYTNLTLKDAQFYVVQAPYPNQKTVDNIRVLRQLSTDRLHQKMIEAQYR